MKLLPFQKHYQLTRGKLLTNRQIRHQKQWFGNRCFALAFCFAFLSKAGRRWFLFWIVKIWLYLIGLDLIKFALNFSPLIFNNSSSSSSPTSGLWFNFSDEKMEKMKKILLQTIWTLWPLLFHKSFSLQTRRRLQEEEEVSLVDSLMPTKSLPGNYLATSS